MEAALTQSLSSDSDVADYISLLKPKVISLVVFTAFAGLLAAPGEIHPFIAFTAILCVALGAGGAGAINCWWERDLDRKMTRTQNRPLPQYRVDPSEAIAFGLFLSFFSVITMGLVVNYMAAGILAFSIFFYAVVYTMWLKPRTPQNIVIGGAAGAFPPMIGWAAVTGSITLTPFLFFLIIFFWTPPHFWALALFKEGEYAKAGIPMLPNVAGRRATQHQILVYSLILTFVSLTPGLYGTLGAVYLTTAAIFGALFLIAAGRLWQDDTPKNAGQLFGFSIFYLFALFTAVIFESLQVI